MREGVAEMRSDLRHMSHDIKGVLQSLQSFVPRREVEAMQAASVERTNVLHARIDTVERVSAERSDTQDKVINERVLSLAGQVREVKENQAYLTHKLIGVGLAAAAGGGTAGVAILKVMGGH